MSNPQYWSQAEELTGTIEPFLNDNGTTRQPSRMDTGSQHLNPMAMRMAMSQHTRVRNGIRSTGIELIQQHLTRIQPHKHASTQ